MTDTENWFASWFDSPYYHILYKNRDHKEAEYFLTNLTQYLKPNEGNTILDLACGAGRHSIFLNKLGHNVTGVDFAPNSIETAKKSLTKGLNFDVHDMREVYKENEFDFILNLFTSFGYFDSDAENIKMIQSVEKSLTNEGIFVLDFFNAKKVIADLIPNEKKTIDGIEFNIQKELKDGRIIKQIDFEADNKNHSFKEIVQAITLSDFKALFSHSNLNIIATFGNYSLDDFDETESDRLILIAQKKNG